MTHGLASASALLASSMDIAAYAWAGWMVAISLQVIPLAVVALLLDRLLRRAGPAVQSALWWTVIARLVLPPTLALPMGQLAPPASRDASMARASVHVAAANDPSHATAVASLVLASDAAMARARAASGAIDARVAFALWLAGVLLLTCVARWRYRRVRRQCLASSSLADEKVVAIAQGAAVRLGMRGLPSIRVACGSGVAQPIVLGFLAPVVVLPASMLERSRVELEHVLLHELAHVRRRDPAATLVCVIAQIVFWFHPAVWCARRRLATLREMACDRAVARVLGEGTAAYRRTLMLLARSAATVPAAGTMGLFQRRSALVTRLELLARPVTMRRGTECVVGVLLAIGVLVSCMPRKPPSSATAAATEWREIPPLDQLPGSLQKRYAVMRAMALTAAQQESEPR